jgi:hypothetical protein
LWLEAHIEHAIGLVHHYVGDLSQANLRGGAKWGLGERKDAEGSEENRKGRVEGVGGGGRSSVEHAVGLIHHHVRDLT